MATNEKNILSRLLTRLRKPRQLAAQMETRIVESKWMQILRSHLQPIEVEVFLVTFIAYFIRALSSPFNLAVKYTGTLPILPNQHGYLVYSTVRALVEDHTFIINRFMWPKFYDVAYHAGNFYMAYPPGIAITMIPFYVIATLPQPLSFLGRAILGLPNIISATLCTVLVYKICALLKVSKWASVMTSMAYAFGTILSIYSQLLAHHPIASLVLLSSAYLAVKYANADGGKLCFLASGFLVGFSTLFEFPDAVFIIPLAGYLTLSNRKRRRKISLIQLAAFAVAFMIGLSFIMMYNNLCFGNPLTFPEAKLVYSGSPVREAPSVPSWRLITKWVKVPSYDAVFGLTFSSYRGVFFFSPVLLIALPGFYLAYRKGFGFEALFLAVTFGLFLFYYSNWHIWWGGTGYGPRFLISVTAFLIIPMAFTIDEWGSRHLFAAVFAALFSLSVIFCSVGALAYLMPKPSPATVLPGKLALTFANLFNLQDPSAVSTLLSLVIIATAILHMRQRIGQRKIVGNATEAQTIPSATTRTVYTNEGSN